MIEKITIVLTSMGIGVVGGIALAVIWPSREPPAIVKVDQRPMWATQIREWSCSKEEFTEYRRVCLQRKRMDLVKPKEQ